MIAAEEEKATAVAERAKAEGAMAELAAGRKTFEEERVTTAKELLVHRPELRLLDRGKVARRRRGEPPPLKGGPRGGCGVVLPHHQAARHRVDLQVCAGAHGTSGRVRESAICPVGRFLCMYG